MKKIIIPIIIVFLQVLSAAGQTTDIYPTLDVDNLKRGLSPQVALMNRYGDYPVDLQNGLVDISIPLYTIQTTSGLTMPLQLKFHASGLQADEREGLLGIRWALAGGGHVSRIIKGYADEFYPFNNLVSNPDYNPDFFTLFGTTANKKSQGSSEPGNSEAFTSGYSSSNGILFPGGSYKDTEYDIFSYSLPSGKSGKFILKNNTDGSKTACLMPYEPMKVSVYNSGSSYRFTSVAIIDEDGTTYRFGEKRGGSLMNMNCIDANEDNWVTTWHLTSIISANKKDTVLIDYKRSGRDSYVWDKSLTVSDNMHDYSIDVCNYDKPYEEWVIDPLYVLLAKFTERNYYYNVNDVAVSVGESSPYFMHAIQWRTGGKLMGSITLGYTADTHGNLLYLQSMDIRDAQNNSAKKIGFVLKNNLSNNLKLLDKIEFINIENSGKKETYTFDYYDSQFVPICGRLSKDSDRWGFYSEGGGWLRSGSISVKKINCGADGYITENISGGDKQTRKESMQIGMLKKIQYPTGGETEFEYEVNRYGTTGSGSPCGGLRISKIKNKPETGKTEIKRYEYEIGYLPNYLFPPSNNIYTENEMECYYIPPNIIGSASIPGWGSYIQRTYQNSFPSRYTDFHSTTVSYPSVTEYIENSSGENTGKIVYVYGIHVPAFSYYDAYDSTNGFYEFRGYGGEIYNGYRHGYVSPTGFWQGNKLLSKTIYKGTQKVKKYTYRYTTYTKESVFDLPVYRYRKHLIIMADLTSYDGYGKQGQDRKEINLIYLDCSTCVSKTFAFKHQEYTIGTEKLTMEIDSTFQADGNTIATVKEMAYDGTYLLPTEEKITNSNGKITTTSYKYPFDFNFTPYTNMVNRNILTPIKEQTEYRNNVFTQKKITDYKNWGDNLFTPEYIKQQTANQSSPETRITYHDYDSHGNPCYITRNDADKVVYLWGYNHQYPVAEIRNATYAEVVGAIVGGQSAIDNIAANSTLSSSDSIKINNLRNQLPAAQVTTYTYKPLIGMTSKTGPSSVITYYNYDGFGRLQTVKDRNNSKVEEYDYHYKY